MSQQLLPTKCIKGKHKISSTSIKPVTFNSTNACNPSKSIPKLIVITKKPNTINDSKPNSKPNPNNTNNKITNSNNNTSQTSTTILINGKNPIKVQNEFMDAMTNAIIRYLDKNPDSSKTIAEESVFIALGYDKAIETAHNNDDLSQQISHFRRHHIMRNRDAIRTFRIKQIHNNIMKQYPNYTNTDILIHLTSKLNILYLPSPSPPPPIISNISSGNNNNCKPNNINNNGNNREKKENNSNVSVQNISCRNNRNKLNRIKKNKTNRRIPNNKNSVQNQTLYSDKYRVNKKQNRIKNVNYTINQSNNKAIIRARKKQFINSQNTNKPCIPIQSQRKYKKREGNKIMKQNNTTFGFKHSIINNKPVNIILSKKTMKYNDSYNEYKRKPSHKTHIYYNDNEIIAQKIKLHKTRKRKLFDTNNINSYDAFDTFDDFDNFDQFDNETQPPKKRTRMDSHTHTSVFDDNDKFDNDQSDINNTTNTHL